MNKLNGDGGSGISRELDESHSNVLGSEDVIGSDSLPELFLSSKIWCADGSRLVEDQDEVNHLVALLLRASPAGNLKLSSINGSVTGEVNGLSWSSIDGWLEDDSVSEGSSNPDELNWIVRVVQIVLVGIDSIDNGTSSSGRSSTRRKVNGHGTLKGLCIASRTPW